MQTGTEIQALRSTRHRAGCGTTAGPELARPRARDWLLYAGTLLSVAATPAARGRTVAVRASGPALALSGSRSWEN